MQKKKFPRISDKQNTSELYVLKDYALSWKVIMSTTIKYLLNTTFFLLGWWLSMHPKDSFFNRLQPLDNYAHLFSKQQRFGTWNPETLGMMLVRFCKAE